VSLDFLTPALMVDGAGPANPSSHSPVARSPMERSAQAEGASFEVRSGWNVAVGYTSREQETDLCTTTVGWSDISHLGKLELQASPEAMRAIVTEAAGGASLELGHATRAGYVWWLPLTASRTLVVCEAADAPGLKRRLSEAASKSPGHASVADVTSVFAALTLVGPLAREVFARFCAVDLRPAVTPVAALRPGSIARQPGLIVREDENRFLFLFGWAVGEYMWTVVADAARHLGGGPVGLDALSLHPQPTAEPSRA
jgi:heterotetrameric sarcosine oxidase gamma subunit